MLPSKEALIVTEPPSIFYLAKSRLRLLYHPNFPDTITEQLQPDAFFCTFFPLLGKKASAIYFYAPLLYDSSAGPIH